MVLLLGTYEASLLSLSAHHAMLPAMLCRLIVSSCFEITHPNKAAAAMQHHWRIAVTNSGSRHTCCRNRGSYLTKIASSLLVLSAAELLMLA